MLRCPGSSAQRLHRNVDIAILAAAVQLSGGYCCAQDTTIAGPSECDGRQPMRSAMAPTIQNSAVSKPARAASAPPHSPERRVDGYDWTTIGCDLNAFGCAVLQKLLAPDECEDLASLYPEARHFRSHIHMVRHGFGKGEYRYFKYPLPDLVGALRASLYSRAVTFANAWNERMNIGTRYPALHA